MLNQLGVQFDDVPKALPLGSVHAIVLATVPLTEIFCEDAPVLVQLMFPLAGLDA